MELNPVLNDILMEAFNEAKFKKHEYLTPEHLLYAILQYEEGRSIIEATGGDVRSLRHNIEEFFKEKMEEIDVDEPKQSSGFQNVMERAIWHTASAQKEILDIGDVLVSILDEEESFAAYFMGLEGINRYELLKFISHGVSVFPHEPYEDMSEYEDVVEKTDKKSGEKFIEMFTTELTAKAMNGEIDPLIGREDIIERTIQVLCRRTKNNPVHVGDPGVGKTAITEGLALRIAEGNVPEKLKGLKIFSLDIGSLLAGTKFRGDFEERMKKVIQELKNMKDVILFIDEIHNVVGAGAVSGGSMDASNMLKPVLTSGEVKCIGSTTYEEYKKYFDKDRALSRRFQKIEIPEPGVEDTVKILQGIKDKYEEYHKVKYTDESLRAAAELSSKYINDRHLPDKAIDVIDEAGSYARIYNFAKSDIIEIGTAEVEKIVARMAKLPEKSVSSSEKTRLKDLSLELKKEIFGQENAIELVVNAIKRSRAGFGNPVKPIASLLFVGPTGVGKTELARQLALSLGVELHRFDMSEYQEKHTVARLIGAPPGYVGYDEGGLLTEMVRKTPYAVLLLDEIEKAHSDIFNTLLQVMDYATLTDNTGKKADFRNVIIIMTSNAGAREIGKKQVGFDERHVKEDAIDKAVDRLFSPEFRNRLDATVTFNDLTEDIILDIVGKEIDSFSGQLKDKNVTLEVTPECRKWLAKKGYSREFGARQIGRLVQDKLKSFFVDEVLFGKLSAGGHAVADLEGDEVRIRVV
ncbi:MAG TPA: ATP-dependent Clp protease ATP-binding subunit ClpA [Spirochaetota bacterium]|nr:ATP-dependent Clp protease ATP-binding subunit ClpA [Spirochaetota bacterium]HPS86185.1 ATP-dependent Clp protease ATP-binding subunit ClpA [Spirochaetota bacterium]